LLSSSATTSAFWDYLASVRRVPLTLALVAGVNALFSARTGDVVRLTMAHRAIKGSTYTTLISSSLVLAIDALCVTALFAWAVTQGVLPSLDVVPYLPSFDFAWFLRHETAAEVTLVVVAFALVVLGVWIRAHAAEFRQRVARHSPSSALLHGGSAPS
jgi:cation transporter-like permease